MAAAAERIQEAEDQLQIKETGKSREIDGDVTWIRRVGDYFLIEKKFYGTSSRLSVHAMDGSLVTNIRENSVDINLQRIVQARTGINSIISGLGSEPRDNRKNIGEFPPNLQRLILIDMPAMAGRSEQFVYSLKEQLRLTYTNSHPSQEICGGKYLVDHNHKNLFAIQVQNESGAPLPQDQWKVYTLATLDQELPADLEKWIQEKKTNERNLSLTASLDAVVSTAGLTIHRAGDRSSVLFTEPSITDPNGNFVITNGNPRILYYLPSLQPQEVKKIVLADDAAKITVSSARFPTTNRYADVANLCLDPTESFFVFSSGKNVNIVEIDTLEQVQQLQNAVMPTFDSTGTLSVITPPKENAPNNSKYQLRFYDADFASFAQKRQAAQHQRIAQRLGASNIFMTPEQKAAADAAQRAEQLQPIINEVLPAFEEEAENVRKSRDLKKIEGLESALEGLRQKLAAEMVGKPADVLAVTDVIRLNVIEPLKRELYQAEATRLIAEFSSAIQKSLSLAAIQFLEEDCRNLESMSPFLEDTQRQQVVQLSRDLQRKTSEYMSLHGQEFIRDAENIVKNATKKLESFASKAEMDDWLEYDMPTLLSSLGMLLRTCPPEAVAASTAIVKARQDLTALATQYEMQFKREYAKVRERAFGRAEEMARIIAEDVQRFLERIRDKQFSTRKEAEVYVQTSQNYQQILDDISALKQKDPDKARAEFQQFEVKLSNLFYAIDRNAGKTVAETGQQIVFFGDTQFPVWEGKVKERGERKVDIVFLEDVATHGPGISPDKLLGDIAVRIVDAEGRETTVRLFQELQDEDEYRYGYREKRGEALPPSYITGEQYRVFRRDLADWVKGPQRSLVQREYQARIAKIRELFATRPMKSNYQTTAEWEQARTAWKESTGPEHERLLREYTEYCQEHTIALLRRIDQIRNQPEAQHVNGKGYVPEWQSHWVADPQTEQTLEDMARTLGMQSELQEGMLLLKGHAGTGKDVLVKMFCAETHRPYFAMDCTKWTTEYELSEDVALESENGASRTVKIPSVVLNAITTPGAVLYFNEINAMPEQAQIFLHSLLDEKRSLTLKTSSGKTIKAHQSLLIMGSMNQGYPGTFAPQFATRSRTVSIDVTYPPFLREPDRDDPNQKEKPINVSEALRIARGVSSLQELTYEMDLSRNEFVKLWDKYINGIDTGAPNPTLEQKFDLDVLLALVTFANELREHFIATFESQKKTRSGAKPLEVRQPLTGREMRRCAYALSKIPASEKVGRDTDGVARELLAKYFLTHLDDTEARAKIELHLRNLFSKKRLAAP